jgi:hypothetical protein
MHVRRGGDIDDSGQFWFRSEDLLLVISPLRIYSYVTKKSDVDKSELNCNIESFKIYKRYPGITPTSLLYCSPGYPLRSMLVYHPAQPNDILPTPVPSTTSLCVHSETIKRIYPDHSKLSSHLLTSSHPHLISRSAQIIILIPSAISCSSKSLGNFPSLIPLNTKCLSDFVVNGVINSNAITPSA